MGDQVGVRVLVDLESNRNTFGSGSRIEVGDLRQAPADRKASDDWS